MRALLAAGRYPARNVDQNLADLRAQVAACAKGATELRAMVAHFGLAVVRAYMRHVQDNAEEAVRRVIDVLKDGAFELRDGQRRDDRASAIAIDQRAARGRRSTSPAPARSSRPTSTRPRRSCKAAVLYVFRTLVDDDIPMNAGCLKPLHIVIPEGSMLAPALPGGGRRRQRRDLAGVTDALYGALGVMAASQGTMNNFTFGNARYQYYETICRRRRRRPGLRRRERACRRT